METLNLDQAFLEKIKLLRFQYENKIPSGMFHYYKEILAGNDIESYMAQYSLSKEDLLKYARVCKILEIYKQIIELIEMAKQEVELLGTEDLGEYQGYVDELQTEGENFLNNLGDEEPELEDTIDFSDINGLIIYPSYIEESKQKIDNSRSGKGEETRKSVASIIERLVYVDYMSLRKKNAVHQTHQPDTKKPCYIDGNALERMGHNTSTKVTYIRLSLSEKNRETIKKTFNIDFDTFYLVVSYGDFKNEGIDEKPFYNEIYANIKKNMKELMLIIDIFKNDFTPETYPLAMNLISEGLRRTEEIISITKNNRNDGLNI